MDPVTTAPAAFDTMALVGFRTSATVGKLMAALAAVQAEMKPPVKDRTVKVQTQTRGSYEFSYATLASVLEAAAPLHRHGIAVVQAVGSGAVTTRLALADEWIESRLPFAVRDAGMQALGSAITYARRYALSAILSLAPDEDDDGNAGDGNAAEVKPRAAAPPKAAAAVPARPKLPPLPRGEGVTPEALRGTPDEAEAKAEEWVALALTQIADCPDSESLSAWISGAGERRQRLQKYPALADRLTLAIDERALGLMAGA